MPKVLIVAFNFPPMSGTSAAQRTLSLCRYLPEHDWLPIVLCPKSTAYPLTDPAQLEMIPHSTIVHRCLALDASRHLAIAGHHPPFFDVPDRWLTWWISALPSAIRLIRKHRPQVMLSTFPLATAHLIALAVHRVTPIPWVSDFRDVMIEDDYPKERVRRRVWEWIERRTVATSACSVFTTPGALRLYRERYPYRRSEHWVEIGNGYEEDDFSAAEARLLSASRRTGESPLRLVHSGVLYPHERDPRGLFNALSNLMAAGKICHNNLEIVFRGARHEAYHNELVAQLGLQGIVSFAPTIPYADAIREMCEADGLLVIQGSVCNNQIPAKVYEYFRSRRPVLALVDEMGDTAAVVRDAGIDAIAPLDDPGRIEDVLMRFLSAIKDGTAKVAAEQAIREHARRARVAEFAHVLNSVSGRNPESRDVSVSDSRRV